MQQNRDTESNLRIALSIYFEHFPNKETSKFQIFFFYSLYTLYFLFIRDYNMIVNS